MRPQGCLCDPKLMRWFSGIEACNLLQDGNALGVASRSMRSNKEVVMIAVEQVQPTIWVTCQATSRKRVENGDMPLLATYVIPNVHACVVKCALHPGRPKRDFGWNQRSWGSISLWCVCSCNRLDLRACSCIDVDLFAPQDLSVPFGHAFLVS